MKNVKKCTSLVVSVVYCVLFLCSCGVGGAGTSELGQCYSACHMKHCTSSSDDHSSCNSTLNPETANKHIALFSLCKKRCADNILKLNRIGDDQANGGSSALLVKSNSSGIKGIKYIPSRRKILKGGEVHGREEAKTIVYMNDGDEISLEGLLDVPVCEEGNTLELWVDTLSDTTVKNIIKCTLDRVGK